MTMDVEIYKPYKKILFDDELDTNSWSREIVNFAKILASHQHNVFITSDTDYQNNISNIYKGQCSHPQYVFISNGLWDKDSRTEFDVVSEARKKGAQVFLLETDLLLSPLHKEQYDGVLTQNTQSSLYSHLEKLILYQHPIYTDSFHDRIKEGVFVGYERDRTSQISEYIVRPNMNWFGKSETFNINNKATKSQLTDVLRKYLYTITISGQNQNEHNFVSQRYYENILHGIINFVDSQYDKSGQLLSINHFRRVKNYIELRHKLNMIDDKLFNELQQEQFDEIHKYTDGQFLYNIIMENITK